MKWMKTIVVLTILLIMAGSALLQARQPQLMSSAEIKIALEKLQVLGGALYIAAHPDDENTAVLSWLSKEKKVRTGYLSLTRGGGGQNLIGSEKGPLMSVLRTHELLSARRIDGAEQFFTRAVDFGYSKTAKESLAIWGNENILEDVVFVIRKFRPDVLLTRFPADASIGGGHGHHTASAMLAVEAFHAAGDPSRFPEQLKHVKPWRPKRVMWNNWRPTWTRDMKQEEIDKLLKVDVGTYNRQLGKSYYEIASLSRSMHKSQGFGSVPRRGSWPDYYELLAGEPAQNDLFDGVDLSWDRVTGSQKLRKLLERAGGAYDARAPHKILPLLMKAHAILNGMPKSYWTVQKAEELTGVIRSCAGLWLEAITTGAEVTPGENIKITATAINRSDYPLTLKKITLPGGTGDIGINQSLRENTPFRKAFKMTVAAEDYTHPFWLREKPLRGLFPAGNHRFKGMATAPYVFNLKMVLTDGAHDIAFDTPVVYRWRDPVAGEKLRDLTVTPPATVSFTEKVFYFPTREPQTVGMVLRSGPAPAAGELKLHLPPGWKAVPAVIPFDIKAPLTEKLVSVRVLPPGGDTSCFLSASVTVAGKTYDRGRLEIRYDHLPVLTFHPKAEVRLVRVNIKRTGRRIGYVMGSGDEIPRFLTQVGYLVDVLSDEDLHSRDLGAYDSIVTGVRAYNTREVLKHVQKRLMKYVSDGGRLVVQYNVSRGLKTDPIGPYPLKLSRGRVTEEDAKISFLQKDHTLMKHPNVISSADFNGWVQERGLYFAGEWDEKYTPLLAANDEGEKPLAGGLLFTRYGKGVFIYNGYSFFRQLPAGVPGALKLFTNIVDGQKPIKSIKDKG